MNLLDAKLTLQHAIESYEGEGWDDVPLRELRVYVAELHNALVIISKLPGFEPQEAYGMRVLALIRSA
jgi:hypothetical protein